MQQGLVTIIDSFYSDCNGIVGMQAFQVFNSDPEIFKVRLLIQVIFKASGGVFPTVQFQTLLSLVPGPQGYTPVEIGSG